MALQPERMFRNDRCATVAAQQTFRAFRMYCLPSGICFDVWQRRKSRQPAVFFKYLFFLIPPRSIR